MWAPGLFYTAPLADRYPNTEHVPAERRRFVIDLELFLSFGISRQKVRYP